MTTTSVLKMRSGIYRCPDHIKNFRISVKLKKLHSSSTNCDSDIDLNIPEKETKTLSWQEKVFSRKEIEFYSKESNCLTDRDKHYHGTVSGRSESPTRLFSYIDEDDYYPNEENVTTEISPYRSELHQKMSELRLGKKIKDSSKTISAGYEINKFLNNSLTNPFTSNCYETMYVMADLGDSEAASNVWLESEHILCCLKYDEGRNLLWIYPDFSADNHNPYTLEVDIGGKILYEYFIENISGSKNPDSTEQENAVLEKINRRNQESKTLVFNTQFLVPPRNVYNFYLFFEILSAKNFEYDNIYIQYHIDLPENWGCKTEDSLYGTTQTCKTRGSENNAYFGHSFEVCLELKMTENMEDMLPPCPLIYFQVISRDSWERYRSEGFSYKFIPIFEPTTHEFTAQCIRICPKFPAGELRRYFIGDYFNIDDVSWVGLPKEHQGNTINKYGVPTIGTGSIAVRLNIVNQSKPFENAMFKQNAGDNENNGILHRRNASNLVKSVGEVVMAYKRARDKMLLARMKVIENEE